MDPLTHTMNNPRVSTIYNSTHKYQCMSPAFEVSRNTRLWSGEMATPGNPRPKPYEEARTSTPPTPFKPPSGGRTSDVVESSGTAKPGEIVPTTERNSTVNRNSLGRPLPTRTWEQNYGNSYGGNAGYGSGLNYNSGYSFGMNNSYGGLGGSYGGGLYGNSMYRSPYGGQYGGSSLYGGGMYNNGFGGPMGSYGMGMGGPYGNQDPNNPFGQPPSPPGFWMSFLNVVQGVVSFFGRISILIDQNTQALHMFMSALLQLFDRSGMLYGELARFVLRLLGIKTKSRKPHNQGPGALPGSNPHGQNYIEGPPGQNYIEGSKAASGSWDNVWGQ